MGYFNFIKGEISFINLIFFSLFLINKKNNNDNFKRCLDEKQPRK